MVYRISNDCLNCGVCLDKCEITAITERAETYFIDPDECNECGVCRSMCPVQAIAEEEATKRTSES